MGHGDQNINLPGDHNFSPDPKRVQELMALIDGPFHLGKPATDREAWDAIRSSQLGEQLLHEARKANELEPLNCFTNEDCLYVIETQDRAPFDKLRVPVAPRQVLLPIAECLEPDGQYLPRIEEGIQQLCAVNSWTFPLHQLGRKLYDREAYFVDLVSTHYAGNLTSTLHLLEDRLKPKTCQLIRDEIETRIFKPFEERVKSGRDGFWWFIVNHNWNSVCLSQILSCALRLKEDPEERAWYIATVEKLLKHSEDSFEHSGFYIEGVGYWAYGYSHYVLGAELVRGATGDQIDWMQKPRVEKASHFGHRMEIQQQAYPTFADCKRDVLPAQWLKNWLNNRIDSNRKTRKTAVPSKAFDPIHFQFSPIIHLLLFHQIDPNQAYAVDEGHEIRDWFEDVQFLISRPGEKSSSRLAATFKGGHNGANHNHNDLGTFTVLSGKEELLTDPGAEVYDKRTFSVQRYEGDLLNSFGHPVPVIGGELQFPDKTYHRTGFGRDAYTVLVDTTFTEQRDQVILEMDRAYKVRHLENLIRAFRYDRTSDGSVEVCDQVKYSQADTYETALITYADWQQLHDGRLRISANGEAIEVEVSCDQGELEFSHCVIQESSTPTRLSWRLKEPILEANIRIYVTSIQP
jgi:hypothetical protein